MIKILRVLFLLLALTASALAQQSQVNVLAPTWTVVNYPDFTLDVVGGGFVSGAQVLWNSVPLATTFVNSSELQSQVPSGNLLQPGAIPISVKNADGTISGSQNFTIRTSYAQVDRVVPQAFPATVGVPLTIYGQNFISGAHVVVDGYDEGQGTLVSATQINATLGSASHLAAGYAHQVRVTYPPVANPYGGSLTPAAHTTSPITATVSPAAVSFGNQTTGTTSASAKVFSLAAGASPMSIGSISISGSSTFTQTNNCPATLNPGQYCTVDVKFAPTSATSFTATLTAIDNAQNSPQTAALSGTGVAPGTPPPSSPAVQLSPSGFTFGEVPVSTTSGTMTSVLTNTGTATLTFTSIAVTGANAGDFTLATGGSNCPPSGTLAASASCNLSATFNTSTAQDESASITITDNAGDSPESVPMTATGYIPSGSSGCSVAKPTSLLCGQTAEHFSLPPGWTLAQTEGFDSGSFAGNEAVPSSCCTISGANPHTGSKSLVGTYSSDGSSVGIYINGALGSYTSLYISYWDYISSSGLYGNNDFFILQVLPTATLTCPGQDFLINSPGPPGQFANYTSNSQENFTMQGESSNTTGPCNGLIGYGSAKTETINAVKWRQHEIFYTPSTAVASTPQVNPYPSSCSSPSQAGCGNGYVAYYINGVLQFQYPNGNLNGTQNMQNATLLFGGTLTMFCESLSTNNCATATPPVVNTGLCDPFSACPGPAPGGGAPPAFQRYIDDIIVMKQ